ncbi:MAG: dihydrodipicolinate reductase C-terminal domain-containing protein, partial [Bdellovibrionales bacterium]
WAHEPTYASLRTGSIVGEHEVMFAGKGETITITHSVTDRRVFAQGALTAALWLAQQPAGFYSLHDMVK